MSKTVLLIDSATKLIIAEPNPPGNLTTIEEMQGQGFTTHSADHQWACRVIQVTGDLTVTNADGVAGDPTFGLTGVLGNLVNLTGAGFTVRGSTGAWVTRSIVGTANQVDVTDGDGLTGNPTLSLPQDIHTGAQPTFAGMTLTGHTGIQKAVGGTLTGAVSGTDYAPATFTGASAVILKNDLSGGFTGAVARTDYLPATTGATMQKSDGAGGLTGATPNTDYLPATVGSAIQKAASGGLTGAVSGVDYAPATFTGLTGSLLKNDLSGGFTAAVSGTDYAPATFTGATSSLLKNDLAGGFTAAASNTDYLPATNPSVTGTLSTPAETVTNTLGSEVITVAKDRDFSAAPNWTGTNWVRPSTGTLTTVAVNSGAKTFTRTGGDFTADGFQVGMTAVWSGFANGGNNGSFVITTLTSTVMTCSAAAGLVTESAGASVSAVSNVWAHTTAGANATTLAAANLTGGASANGQLWQLSYTVVTNTTGTLTPSFGGATARVYGGSAVTNNVTEVVTTTGTADITFTPNGAWVGFLDNISLKQITRSALTVQSQALTAQTLTAVSSGLQGSSLSKYQWTNAMVTGLGANLTGDLLVCTLPARTIVKNAYIVIDTAAGGVTTLTVALGRTGAGYTDYIAASDAKTTAVYGDASGERGANLTGYDLPSFANFTDVYLHFIATGTNLDTVTTSTGTVYLETITLP